MFPWQMRHSAKKNSIKIVIFRQLFSFPHRKQFRNALENNAIALFAFVRNSYDFPHFLHRDAELHLLV